MIKTSAIVQESLHAGLHIQSSQSSRNEKRTPLWRGKRPKMRKGPVETSDFIFGPDLQECLSPDFDRDRPLHTIERPISSQNLSHLLKKYGFFEEIKSAQNQSLLPTLIAKTRPRTSRSRSTRSRKSSRATVSAHNVLRSAATASCPATVESTHKAVKRDSTRNSAYSVSSEYKQVVFDRPHSTLYNGLTMSCPACDKISIPEDMTIIESPHENDERDLEDPIPEYDAAICACQNELNVKSRTKGEMDEVEEKQNHDPSSGEVNRLVIETPRDNNVRVEDASLEIPKEDNRPSSTGRVQTPNIPSIKMKENTFIRTEYKSKTSMGPKVAEYRRIATAQQHQCNHHSHHVDNRELCYLCSQRAARNVPVYTREQEDNAERQNAKILALAEQRKAEEQIKNENQLRSEQRKLNKEVAAFNLGAAQATREKRTEENKHPMPHESYVMGGRPLTPHKSVGYKKVEAELSNQINSIKTSKAKADADKRLIERLYQIQLAEGLAAEREAYLKEKDVGRNKLNKTYQYQIKNRIPELPKHYSDHEIFGKNDVTFEKRNNIRERNRLYSSDQFLTFKRNKTAKERDYQEKVLNETEMLRRTKTDLENDMLKRKNYKRGVRKSLESNWITAKENKCEREIDAKIGIPEKITVQEQLDHYRKCAQCSRKPQNKGESNIWKESYHVHGARIMV